VSHTSSRLLELLSLLQGRRDWPGEELAERLEVSGRTIRRDIERLRALGYPVESLTGPTGGYRLRAGRPPPPPARRAGERLPGGAGPPQPPAGPPDRAARHRPARRRRPARPAPPAPRQGSPPPGSAGAGA